MFENSKRKTFFFLFSSHILYEEGIMHKCIMVYNSGIAYGCAVVVVGILKKGRNEIIEIHFE